MQPDGTIGVGRQTGSKNASTPSHWDDGVDGIASDFVFGPYLSRKSQWANLRKHCYLGFLLAAAHKVKTAFASEPYYVAASAGAVGNTDTNYLAEISEGFFQAVLGAPRKLTASKAKQDFLFDPQ